MFCNECGKNIEEGSKFCRNCGVAQIEQITPNKISEILANTSQESGSSRSLRSQVASNSDMTPQKPKRQNAGYFWIIGIVVMLVSLAVIGSLTSVNPDATSVGLNAGSTTNLPATDLTAKSDELAADAALDADTDTGTSPWTYSTDEDKVRKSKSYSATATSTNSIEQNPPYNGGTTMAMTVRNSPAYGTDVILTISEGQMMCPSYEGCSGTVRFDEQAPQKISFNGPADNSSDTIFVIGAKSFISKLKKSKKVVIEKTLYEAGNPQFEFDVSDLKWDH